MVEKRFNFRFLIDDKGHISKSELLDNNKRLKLRELEDIVNDLHEENMELKKQLENDPDDFFEDYFKAMAKSFDKVMEGFLTKKRFGSNFYEDTGRTITDNNEELSQNEVVDLLNELHEENISLKEENEQLKIKLIYNFIKNNIIPKYDVLCSCKVQDNEFYIEYDEFLSFDERNILNREILQQIYDFCVSLDIEEDCFFNISVFLVIKR